MDESPSERRNRTCHASFEYLHNRGADVELQALEKPQNKWDSITQVFQDVFRNEKAVTASINALVDLSITEKNTPPKPFFIGFSKSK